MRGNLPGPEGLARRGASAALHGLPVVTTTGGAARLASAPSPCQRGSREILRQAPGRRLVIARYIASSENTSTGCVEYTADSLGQFAAPIRLRKQLDAMVK